MENKNFWSIIKTPMIAGSHGDGDAVQGKLFILREAFNKLGTVVGTDENKDQDKTAESAEKHTTPNLYQTESISR